MEASERATVRVHHASAEASAHVAAEIAQLIRAKQAAGERCVLGLATGSTPTTVYAELVRLHREEQLSFRGVTTFNLDEYWPMPPDDRNAYRRFMNQHLFDHIDIDKSKTYVPSGIIEREEAHAHCEDYERMIESAGGIDLQVLGIGRTGHIGFNEPGSLPESHTRMVTLDRITRADAAKDFGGEWRVPRQAITMGVRTILDARRIRLLAFGSHKAEIVRRAVEEPPHTAVSASYLQTHRDAAFVLDPAAAARLTRFNAPWLMGPISDLGLDWDDRTTRRAVCWLSEQVGRPVLKLTDADYNSYGLGELLSVRGAAYDINIEVFKSLQTTITGWPGGKPGRPKFVPGRGIHHENGPDTVPKRILVFSPHPDDDVISMGGTLIRLCDQGHEVHVAYQTSGNIAVFDEEAVRQLELVREICHAFGIAPADADALLGETHAALGRKADWTEPDAAAVRRVKGLIRRCEARAASEFAGVSRERIYNLDLPFYETGLIKKKALGRDDVRLTADLLDRVKPHQIYCAGDLVDPHGTHRVCLEAVAKAIDSLRERAWMSECEVWLYRGAWEEWATHEIEMAVPLSPAEVERKRIAIFKHESQKDRMPFPGDDTREFWQRAEERTRATASRLDALGLPEYEAIEGFVHWVPATGEGLLAEEFASMITAPIAEDASNPAGTEAGARTGA